MKNKKIIIVLSLITFVFSLFMMIGSQWIFTVCESEGIHRCENADGAVLVITIIMMLTSASTLIFIDEKNLIVSSSLTCAEGLIATLMPGLIIEVCKMDSMSCAGKFKPFVIIMGVLIIISSIINLVYGLYQLKKGNR